MGKIKRTIKDWCKGFIKRTKWVLCQTEEVNQMQEPGNIASTDVVATIKEHAEYMQSQREGLERRQAERKATEKKTSILLKYWG